MKNLLYGTLFLALVGITFVGCDTFVNVTDQSDISQEKKSDADFEVSNTIIEVQKLEALKLMTLVEERLFETDYYKVLVLDFESSNSRSSVLVVLHLDDAYATLIDNQSIRFANLGGGVTVSGQIEANQGDDSYEINGKITLVCNEGCCRFSQPSDNHFRCDCPNSAVDVELSTGSGCVIKMVSLKK